MHIAADADTPHVAVNLPGGLAIEFDSIDLVTHHDANPPAAAGGIGTTISLYYPSEEAVNEVYADLVSAGYAEHQQPYDAFWGGRYAIVDDPDGHAVALMTHPDQAREYWPPGAPPPTVRQSQPPP